jgi:hypothetical protein
MDYPVGQVGSNGEIGADFRGGYYGDQTAWSGGGYDPNAPLAALDSNPMGFSSMKYPRNVGTDPRGHYINFYINVADNTTYQNGGSYTGLNGSTFTGGAGKTAANQTAAAQAVPAGAKTLQGAFTVRKTKRIGGAITLYMPETVNVAYNADWQSQSLTDAAGAIGQYGSLLASGGRSWFGNKTLSGMTPGMAEIVGKALEGNGAGSGAADFALFSQGYALNPQLEVLFKGTDMRQFQFDFLFSPFDADEAKSVISIIKQFKFHQAPEVVADSVGRFFIPPSEFDIDFQYNGQTNGNIHQVGTCVLTNMNVDYAPNGWSTFPDGTPTSIRMTLNFMETEIVTKQRVDQGY